jgi:hypothetical protein
LTVAALSHGGTLALARQLLTGNLKALTQAPIRSSGLALFRFLVVSIVVLMASAAMAGQASVSFSGVVSGGPGDILATTRAEVISFVETAGFEVVLRNGSRRVQQQKLTLTNRSGANVDAAFPARVVLSAGSSRIVRLFVPFGDASRLDLRVCATQTSSGERMCQPLRAKRVALN